MKPSPTEKYNVAWFKLAEFVTRGEKERALGMFRLLMHSINNQALAYQLQGDMLLSFEDPEAIECYRKSAALYAQDKKFFQAATIYEHLLSIYQESVPFHEKIISLYQQLNNEEKSRYFFKKLIRLLTHNQELDHAEMMLQQFEHLVTPEEEALVAQLNLMTHLSNPAYDEKAKSKLLFKTIDLFSEIPNSHHLNTFLSQLESSHKEFYTKALAYLK